MGVKKTDIILEKNDVLFSRRVVIQWCTRSFWHIERREPLHSMEFAYYRFQECGSLSPPKHMYTQLYVVIHYIVIAKIWLYFKKEAVFSIHFEYTPLHFYHIFKLDSEMLYIKRIVIASRAEVQACAGLQHR